MEKIVDQTTAPNLLNFQPYPPTRKFETLHPMLKTLENRIPITAAPSQTVASSRRATQIPNPAHSTYLYPQNRNREPFSMSKPEILFPS